MITRADSQHQSTRWLQIDAGAVGVLDRYLLQTLDQCNLKRLAQDRHERFILLRNLNGETASVEPYQQRLQKARRPWDGGLRNGEV